MQTEEIISRINSFLVDEFEVEPGKIKPEANLRETLHLDSLDYIDLVVVLENNFGFKPKGEDFQDLVSIQDFYNYVIGKVGTK